MLNRLPQIARHCQAMALVLAPSAQLSDNLDAAI